MSLKTNPVSSGYSTGVINSNFKKIEEYVNDNLLNRDGVTPGEPNQMEVDLDMNSQDILNIGEMGAKEIILDGISLKELLDNLPGGIEISDVTGLEDALDDRVLDTDPRLSDSRVPRGGAGGVLSGSYPNPGFAVPMATADQLDTKVDKVAGKGLSEEDYTTADKDKLSGIEDEATKNATDAELRDRATHTGEQAISTVTGLQGELDEKVAETELVGSSPSILIVDQLRASVEAASGGRMTVLYNVDNEPSYMHVFPKFKCEDIAPGGELGTGTHPAFIFNGVEDSEIFVGAYQASNVKSKAVSRPMVAPCRSINHDNARAACKANGPGWDMFSNLDWAAIAQWCMANGYQPTGNTDYGKSHDKKWETGRGGTPALTGSGPAAWAHDGTPAGIHDLVGNIWEWVSGMKLVNGRAWVAPDNGMLEEADFIDSGFDMASASPWSSHASAGASDLVKQSLLAPASPALSPAGRLYVNVEGERLPYRGGAWTSTSSAGLAALRLSSERVYVNSNVGFRSRFRAQ